jgi:hypothetical protein
MVKPRKARKSSIHCPTIVKFVQCPETKIVRENGGTVQKQCIHDDGKGHKGACKWFKFVKRKW